MPAGRKPGFRMSPAFYVYRLFDEPDVTLYVGKGSGRRLSVQKKRRACEGEIIEECASDDHAFERERHWIARLHPTENKVAGGNGGRCKPKPRRRKSKEERGMELVGTRCYTARFLLRRLGEHNRERFGVSKVDLDRLREVASGQRI